MKAGNDNFALVYSVASSYDIGNLYMIDKITFRLEVLRTLIRSKVVETRFKHYSDNDLCLNAP
ncbi:hypothetical protein GGQ79_000589 [Ochrobactrum pecoris]|uniref:Uncharacterized protein n=1 Tax=Brucella pecoris TaxID=867683 RepID=A0AB34YM80_9HYPH|nr:hypothetical protein [Brucella pecoris]